MDPFKGGKYGLKKPSNGKLYINLGQVSEDILPDARRAFENGLPIDGLDTSVVDNTLWGRVPRSNPPTQSFHNDASARANQDVGLDGWTDEMEREFRSEMLDTLDGFLKDSAFLALKEDPSTDNYVFSRGDVQNGETLLERYRSINGHQGNSPVENASENGYTTSGSTRPDTEDLNGNGTLNSSENYWEYEITLDSTRMNRGQSHIVDILTEQVVIDGRDEEIDWYQFRIPIRSGNPVNIENFKSIDYIRMYMTGFEEEVVLRFASLQVVSTTWRTYKKSLGNEGEIEIDDPDQDQTNFEIGTVSIEENSGKKPFNYQIPPDIERVVNQLSSQQPQLQNEEALLLKVCNLEDGDGRGAFKLNPVDLRSFLTAQDVGACRAGEPGSIREWRYQLSLFGHSFRFHWRSDRLPPPGFRCLPQFL